MTIQFVRDDLIGYVVGRVRHDTPDLAAGVLIPGQIIPKDAAIIRSVVVVVTAFDGTATTVDLGHIANVDCGGDETEIDVTTVGAYEPTKWQTGAEATAGLTTDRQMRIRITGTHTAGELQAVISYMRRVETVL